MLRPAPVIGLFACFALLSFGEPITFVPVSFPGAGGTLALGINDAGQVVGIYSQGTGNMGVLRKRWGLH